MSFIVEDGTGKSDATSYQTVAECKAYWDSIGVDYSLLSDAQIEVYLNKGANALTAIFQSRLSGYKAVAGQRLDFPRYQCEIKGGALTEFWLDSSGAASIPERLKEAQSILANDARTKELMPNIKPRVLEKSLGRNALSIKYAQYGSQLTQYTAVEALLAPYLSASSNQGSYTR